MGQRSEITNVIDTGTLLKNPRSKIKRANRHIDELRRRSAPLDRTLYEIVQLEERATVLHLNPTSYRIVYRPKEDIAETFAGIIQDAFNNIREAFDFTAVAIVDEWGRPEDLRLLYFPFAPRKDLVSHSGLAAIEKALPGFKESFLKNIRPENGRNERLWDFYTLHKDGKHNDYVPVVTLGEIVGINARGPGGFTMMQNCGVGGFPATSPMGLVGADHPITVDNNFYASVQIQFGKGTAFEDEPVVPTLTQVSQLASETIDWIAQFIRNAKRIN